MKRLLTLLIMTAVMVLCSACHNFNHDYREDVQEFALITETGDLSALDEYPNLQYVDLRGSTCYDEILEYAASHPQMTVRYNVQLGQARVNQDVSELSLYDYEYDFDLLLKNLKYLPDLQKVSLKQTTLTADELALLQNTYPNVSFDATVELRSIEIPHTETALDLSHLTADDVQAAVEALKRLPDLQEIELMNSFGNSNLSLTDVKPLVDAVPNVKIHYEFDLFGQRVSIGQEQLIFDDVKISNDGVPKLRNALNVMTKCTYAKFDSCEIDDEIMAQLRSDYPEKKIVWRVFIGKYNLLTDEEMVRMNANLTDQNTVPLKYCNDVKYIDISSNKNLTDFSFLASMPKLEAVSLTLTKINNLSCLSECKNLVWLELTSCSRITDLSPLSGLNNLKYLNVAATKVTDLTALDNLALERFACARSTVDKDALAHFEAKHPDCLAVSTGNTRGYGWRYDDTNGTLNPYYRQLREIFRYNEKNFTGNRKGR